MRRLHLHDDRALPAEPTLRGLARAIYSETRDLPLVAMHGHVDAGLLAADDRFPDPAHMLVVPDHYLVRMLVSQGVAPESLGLRRGAGGHPEADPREIWRRLCERWHVFRGTPSRFWLEHELALVFGAKVQPSPESSDHLYDLVAQQLAMPDFHPRALFARFRIEVLATTDSALSSLADHHTLEQQGWRERVLPTFRPDELLDCRGAGWAAKVARLAELTGVDTGTYDGYLEALQVRRQAFLAAGGRATDHGQLTAEMLPLDQEDARRIFDDAMSGRCSDGAAAAFSGNMLFEMARMSCDDGLVMQLHPGVLRDHSDEFRLLYGSDTGFDIPIAIEFTRALRPVLQSFGRNPRFRLIVYTVDETAYSRELAPLAGVYPALKLGAPWWFLDSVDGMRRFREAVTETAGFYNTTGFVDDTRAFASIPARHDLARRVDAGYLAKLVGEHTLALDEAVETAVDLAYHIPKAAYASRPEG